MRASCPWCVALTAALTSLIATSNRTEAAAYLGNALLGHAAAYSAGCGCLPYRHNHDNYGPAYSSSCGHACTPIGCCGAGCCGSGHCGKNCGWKPGCRLDWLGLKMLHDTGEGSFFNCGCGGSYKFPVPPLSTYHWVGLYAYQLTTDYQSPWRFPAVTPFGDTDPKPFNPRDNRYPDGATGNYREGRVLPEAPNVEFDQPVIYVEDHRLGASAVPYDDADLQPDDDRYGPYPNQVIYSYRQGRVQRNAPQMEYDPRGRYVGDHHQEESAVSSDRLMSNVMTNLYGE